MRPIDAKFPFEDLGTEVLDEFPQAYVQLAQLDAQQPVAAAFEKSSQVVGDEEDVAGSEESGQGMGKNISKAQRGLGLLHLAAP